MQTLSSYLIGVDGEVRVMSGIVNSFLSLLILYGLLVSACISVNNRPASPAVTPITAPAKASYLVLVSIDACRPDYFSIAEIPAIKKLMSEGTNYTNAWVGELRNDTPPGHTALATGSFPRHNGILGFTWKDPVAGKQINPTDWDSVVSGTMTRIIAGSGCTSIGSLYKKAYPGARVAAISSDKFYAATGLGAESADYILFNSAQHVKEYAQKGGINLLPGGVTGHLASPDIMNDPSLQRKKVNNFDGDTWAVDLAIKLFSKERPQILLLNLPQTDHSGHATGGINNPKEMSDVVGNADTQIGRLVDAYKQAGIYDQTIFVVTADHGMTPETFTISMPAIRRLLTQSGITIVTGGREIYLVNPDRAAEAAELIANAGIEFVNGVYYKWKSGDGSYSYLPTPITAKNTNTDLNKCYQYLASTYASEKSCDVLVTTVDENWHKVESVNRGNHGAVTWTNQHIPLVISGPGVKRGVVSESPARLVDIAPTVLTLMGVEPQKMDGIVLADALIQPGNAQVEVQQLINRALLPLAMAMKTRSEGETGSMPPPMHAVLAEVSPDVSDVYRLFVHFGKKLSGEYNSGR
jgi:predicted AlkP superfamily pyrophosphatase or phosphodiesterase